MGEILAGAVIESNCEVLEQKYISQNNGYN
jgi:hypothetical protein